MKKKLVFIPQAYPFSDFVDEDGKQQEFGDTSLSNKLYDEAIVNSQILSLLERLDDRHKIVFMFLMLKDCGYSFTNDECARVLSTNRQTYIKMVKFIRARAKKLF